MEEEEARSKVWTGAQKEAALLPCKFCFPGQREEKTEAGFKEVGGSNIRKGKDAHTPCLSSVS